MSNNIVKAGQVKQLHKRPLIINPDEIDQPIPDEVEILSHEEPVEVLDFETLSERIETEIRKEFEAEREEIIRQAIKKAQHINDEAEQRAEGLLQNAKKQSAVIFEDAEKEGYEKGYHKGMSEGAIAARDRTDEGLAELATMINFIREETRANLADNEKDLVRIAFELAEKIMRQHVAVDENAVPKMLNEIIRENEKTVKVYLAEHNKLLDCRIDDKMYKKIMSLSDNLRVILLKDGDSNAVQVETETGMIDANIAGQLDSLKKALDVD